MERHPARIYLASSWRNEHQPEVLKDLREAGFEVYDFRNPDNQGADTGFHWSDVAREETPAKRYEDWTWKEYTKAIQHPIAERGFLNDFRAMNWADICVMLLDCGNSAHLELGWFVGRGKITIIQKNPGTDEVRPDLMYKMVDGFSASTEETIEIIQSLVVGGAV